MEQSTRLNLPRIRRNRGVSLLAIAENTKIGSAYLEAIEAERFSSLPGEIYSTSYIRQYASAIDYDENAILEIYREQVRGAVLPFPEPAPDRTIGRSLVGVLFVAGRRCCRNLFRPLLT